MKVYSPNDIATILQIKPATLRKYSSLLEKYGYEIGRNSQGHRYYQDKDIITIRNVISGVGGDVSLEESVKNVIKLESGSTVTNDTNIGDTSNDSDISELKNMIHNQGKQIEQQNELLQELFARLDQQQEYINQSINKRDQNLMEAMHEIQEQKQIAASKEEKPGFWKRLFGMSDE